MTSSRSTPPAATSWAWRWALSTARAPMTSSAWGWWTSPTVTAGSGWANPAPGAGSRAACSSGCPATRQVMERPPERPVRCPHPRRPDGRAAHGALAGVRHLAGRTGGGDAGFARINDTRWLWLRRASRPVPGRPGTRGSASGVWIGGSHSGGCRAGGIGRAFDDLSDCKHWFNHLLYNTDGSRLEFLHRWHRGGFFTRMLTVAPSSSDVASS